MSVFWFHLTNIQSYFGLLLSMLTERNLFLHWLRYFSAILVCFSHAKEFFYIHMTEEASNFEKIVRLFMSLGAPGVIIFFFLSGFLVGGNEVQRMVKTRLSPRKYFLDRLTRLWIVLIPALILTSILNVLNCNLHAVSLYCTADMELASHSMVLPLASQSLSSFFANLFFLQPFRVDSFGGNGPLWSLSYEFWYYIEFYFILLILSFFRYGKTSKWFYLFLPLSLVGLTLVNSEWFVLGSMWLSGVLAQNLLSRVDSSLNKFGARFFISQKFIKITVFLLLPSLLALRLLPRYLSFPLAILLLTFSIFVTQNNEKSKMNDLTQRLIAEGSKYSFSLYLLHFPFLALLSGFFISKSRWNLTVTNLFFVCLNVIMCFAVAFAFAAFTEYKTSTARGHLHFLYGNKK